ncbi:2,3-bisphosphoglycerate-independent phosphoglycerate mutase [Clarias magur]|uniref:2,3-bisphosphoglycerate-independent phosphoglycerate mutase n=1 Tax=Clarias magur TaxID=1594786 RepID=A0A8J5CG38_CLAMG|nr:2,3-bisphosphoglycerate-independent phosphoglycerate mutase [Clarias magur]
MQEKTYTYIKGCSAGETNTQHSNSLTLSITARVSNEDQNGEHYKKPILKWTTETF